MISVPNTQTSRVFVAWIALEILILLFAIESHGGFNREALHVTTRFSGRLSLIAFSAVLLSRGTPSAVRLVSEKPYLLFATLHGIHLAELLGYVSWSGTQLIPIRVLGGFVAYAFIFAMPALEKKLGESMFAKVTLAYFGYVWLIFFLTYLPRVMGKLPQVGGTFAEHVTLFVWVIALALIRLSLKYRRKLAA